MPQEPWVVGRHIFYNNSSFDGNDPGAGTEDAAAMAPDKEPLLPGETARFANYTSYSRGINGLMVDVAGLTAYLPDGVFPGVDDFRFRLGNDEDPDGWVSGPSPSELTIAPGEGTGGSDRITLIWPDNLIGKQWLQVTFLASESTGLLADDVFYFGNAVGETGNSAADAKVNAFDMLGVRDHQRNFLNPAPLDFAYDFDRNARVGAADMLIARNNATHFLNALRLITVPNGKAAEHPVIRQEVSAHDSIFQQDMKWSSSHVGLRWLYESDPTAKRSQSSEEHSRVSDFLEELLALDTT